MIMMRTICITVFLTIAYFKSVETTSTSASTIQSESTSGSSINTTEAISTMTSNDRTTMLPSSENTTTSSSESTILPTTANVTSTEFSTEFFSSTLTDGSSMSTTTDEKTTLSVTAGSSTTDVTTTYTTETDTSADTTTTINERSEPTATTNPEVTSTTDSSATEDQVTSTTDSLTTEDQVTSTTDSLTTEDQVTSTIDSLTTEDQVTSTTEYSNTPTGSTHSTATTTHLATEETTDDETSTSPESTVDGTSSESSINATTSTEETSSIRTTTMAPTSTTPSNINDIIPVDTANAVMTVSLEVIFISFVSDQDAKQNMSVALSKIDGFKSVVIENCESCTTKDTNGRKITFKVFFMARVLLQDRENITSEINSTVGSISSVKSLLAFKMPDDMCHSDVCREALLEHKGYNCESDNPDGNCSLVSPCHYLSCKNEGTCTVQANRTHYNSVCKCKEDDMYSYSGIKCENKTISWKLWTIIAAGAGGGIIVVLLFAVVIICAKRKSMPSKAEVYGYDMGYDDRENLMFEPYHSSNENHRKPLSKDERLEQTNLQTFDNQGYDQWDPSESKNTYASMDRHFQSPSFQTQITRPTIKTNKGNDDQLTPF